MDCDLKKNKNKKFCLKKSFPIVMKHPKTKALTIVYAKGVEDYRLQSKESKSQIEKSNGLDSSYEYEDIYGKGWNPHHEVNSLKNSGYKRVKDSESQLWEE